MEESRKCNFRVTIENHLENYAKSSKEPERYEILWHAWKHNKRWLCQLLEWIMPAFPNYSRHDETHARAVLHNIEMILGEEEIEKLSASDCFLILHVVYIHDIGMCITHENRKELMKSKEFVRFLENISYYGDGLMKRYAGFLLTYCQDMPMAESEEKLLITKLDVYYAVLYLVSEYHRKDHGETSKNMLEEWIEEPDKLGIAFSMSGIPSRFFYTIGSCASVHTSYDFEDVMKLHKVDGGFAHDYMHPRFAAVLLQLGDALDLDNDRFHPLMKTFLGDLPESSEIHLGKHRSIRRLFIGTDKIMIEANCSNPEVMRQVCAEYEGIRDILQKATFYWSSICPEELNAYLPALEPLALRLNGDKVREEIVNLKFQITQKNAFNLLQGGNIYENNQFVFLREIFQNAVDASKMQWWKDWKRSRWYEKNKTDIAKFMSPLSYPIEVEMHIAQKEKFGDEYCILGKGEVKEPLYGVLVRMIDHGIGMTATEIREIADAGSSHEPYDGEMPSWLRPTAEFGIGLQSVFLVAPYFKAYTFPHSGEKYEILFRATGDRGNGFINVMPLDEEKEPKKYGTIVEVFIPCSKKMPYSKNARSWSSHDPFGMEYEENKELCDARELAVQLAFYLDSLIGEKLFPIKLKLYDYTLPYEIEKKERIINASYKKSLSNVMCQFLLNNQKISIQEDEDQENSTGSQEEEEFVTWAYDLKKNTDNFITGNVGENCKYAIDCDNIALYLWDRKKNVYAKFGIQRLLALRKFHKNPDGVDTPMKTRIFYKGVFTKEVDWNQDGNLLEYIDIKEKLERKYIAFNRADFTKNGEKYIHDEIYSAVIEMAHKALTDCEENPDDETNIGRKEIFDRIKSRIERLIEENASVDNIQEAILAAVSLAAFAQICGKSEFAAPSRNQRYDNWNGLLEWISGKINENPEKKWRESTFFKFRVFNAVKDGTDDKLTIDSKNKEEHTIADIMSSKKHYAVVSKRSGINSSWEEYLVCLNPESGKNYFKDIKDIIISLKTTWDWGSRKDLLKELEKRGRELVESSKGINEDKESYQAQIINENAILNWMLENMPSIAIFSNRESTIRINILDLEYTDSMYLDRNIKWGIYERLNKINLEKKIERFSTLAMTGYCQLSLQTNPSNVYFVKRGKHSKIGRRYIVLPFTGTDFAWLLKQKDLKKDITNQENKIYKLMCFFIKCENMIKDRQNAGGTGESQELKEGEIKKDMENILDKLEQLYQNLSDGEKSQIIKNPFEELEWDISKEADLQKWINDTLEDKEKESLISWLKEFVLPKYAYLKQGTAFSQIYAKEIKPAMLEKCGLINENSEAFKTTLRLVKYIEENGLIHISSNQYITLYENYIDELVEEVAARYEEECKEELCNYFASSRFHELIRSDQGH